MASAVAMMLGGAVVNAFAFSESLYLFSKMGKNSDEKRKRHDKAMEELTITSCNTILEQKKKRTIRLYK